jgi:hypothetical protein
MKGMRKSNYEIVFARAITTKMNPTHPEKKCNGKVLSIFFSVSVVPLLGVDLANFS